jgi:hypothetical protein
MILGLVSFVTASAKYLIVNGNITYPSLINTFYNLDSVKIVISIRSLMMYIILIIGMIQRVFCTLLDPVINISIVNLFYHGGKGMNVRRKNLTFSSILLRYQDWKTCPYLLVGGGNSLKLLKNLRHG